MSWTLRSLLLLISWLFSLHLNGANVTIKGKATDFKSLYVEVWQYADYLSMKEVHLSEAPVSQEGSFQLTFELSRTEPVVLKIQNRSTLIYCEPGAIYSLNLSISETAPSSSELSMVFTFPQKDELNQQITAFNHDYLDFLIKNEKAFVARRANQLVKDFVSMQQKKMFKLQSGYFKTYLNYNLAAIEHSTLNNSESIYNRYIKDKKVNYLNYEYMKLFKQLYQKRFEFIASGTNGQQLLQSMNKDLNYKAMLVHVKEDRLISGKDSLAELFAMNGVSETFFEGVLLKRKSALNMLQQISQHGLFKEIAANILFNLTNLTKGNKAIEFAFSDINGRQVSSKSLKGKHLYLQFWSINSKTAVRDMILLNDLAQKYPDRLEIISINLNDTQAEIKAFLRSKNYNWTFSSAMLNRQLLRDYQVHTAPFYVLIDQEFNIKEYPARSPTEGIEEVLQD